MLDLFRTTSLTEDGVLTLEQREGVDDRTLAHLAFLALSGSGKARRIRVDVQLPTHGQELGFLAGATLVLGLAPLSAMLIGRYGKGEDFRLGLTEALQECDEHADVDEALLRLAIEYKPEEAPAPAEPKPEPEPKNARMPVGTRVRIWATPNGTATLTRTRSLPWQLGEQWVVLVEGKSGAWSLTHLELAAPEWPIGKPESDGFYLRGSGGGFVQLSALERVDDRFVNGQALVCEIKPAEVGSHVLIKRLEAWPSGVTFTLTEVCKLMGYTQTEHEIATNRQLRTNVSGWVGTARRAGVLRQTSKRGIYRLESRPWTPEWLTG